MVSGDDTLLPWLRAPLAQALRQRAHALLIHGESGVGQFELGLALAQALLCEAADGERPCGRCVSCHLMRARSHPDFFLLIPAVLRQSLGWAEPDEEGAKGAKPSKEIQVAAVREAIAWSQQTPSRGREKLVLIQPAQAMNAVTANALLKTLEEPPRSLRLVLCTSDPELLLPTIRSRCQRLRLAGPSPDEALAWLRVQGIDGAETLLAAAGGRPLDAISLTAEGIDAALWQRLPQLLARGDAAALSGMAVPRVVETLQKLCHDAMARAAGGAPRFFAAETLPPAASMDALAGWAKSLARIARHDEHPWQAPLLIEALVIEAAKALTPASPMRKARLDTLAG
jgi:DNA polymerase-3 subunit delta'